MGAPVVAVVGSVNLDLVTRCERLPRPGETLTDAAFERIPGGKGANQALAAARLGAEVALLGGGRRRSVRDGGAGLSRRRRESSSTASGVVDGADRRRVDPRRGRRGEPDRRRAWRERGRCSPRDVRVRDADAVLCQLEIPIEAVGRRGRAGPFFCLNAAPARALPGELLGGSTSLVVNTLELEAVGRPRRPDRAHARRRGRGAAGGRRQVARAEPPPVEAVDGTAAGDAFTACLARLAARGPAACAGARARLHGRSARRLALRSPAVPPDRGGRRRDTRAHDRRAS